MVSWIIAHGYVLGGILFTLGVVCIVIGRWYRDIGEDDDFDPIGPVPPPPKRTSPFAPGQHRADEPR